MELLEAGVAVRPVGAAGIGKTIVVAVTVEDAAEVPAALVAVT
jgi:hypothetical protein